MISAKNLLYNSVTVSLPKNVIQFFLGFVLFFLTTGSFDPGVLSLALFGFIASYSAVYFYNDIVDCEDDRRDKDKRNWKLVASGVMSVRQAKAAGVIFLAAGLCASLYVNVWFFLIVLTLLILNLLHSVPGIRLKKIMPATAANMTAIEALKFSSGWFAFTGNLSEFPFWIILTFSVAYSGIYIIYKFKFKGSIIREKKWFLAPIAILALLSYTLSIALYKFALPLMLLLVFSMGIIAFSLSVGKKLKLMNWFYLEFIIFPTVIAVFLLLSIPAVAYANSQLTDKIGDYKETVYKELPKDVAQTIRNLSEPAYDSLDEVGKAINVSINISELQLFDSGNQ
ncbi:MAG: UbiA prenyltransferase family protein [Candidatus Aenigmatarchaeota archaeon]